MSRKRRAYGSRSHCTSKQLAALHGVPVIYPELEVLEKMEITGFIVKGVEYLFIPFK